MTPKSGTHPAPSGFGASQQPPPSEHPSPSPDYDDLAEKETPETPAGFGSGFGKQAPTTDAIRPSPEPTATPLTPAPTAAPAAPSALEALPAFDNIRLGFIPDEEHAGVEAEAVDDEARELSDDPMEDHPEDEKPKEPVFPPTPPPVPLSGRGRLRKMGEQDEPSEKPQKGSAAPSSLRECKGRRRPRQIAQMSAALRLSAPTAVGKLDLLGPGSSFAFNSFCSRLHQQQHFAHLTHNHHV